MGVTVWHVLCTKLKGETFEDDGMQSLSTFQNFNGVCVRYSGEESVWSYVPCEGLISWGRWCTFLYQQQPDFVAFCTYCRPSCVFKHFTGSSTSACFSMPHHNPLISPSPLVMTSPSNSKTWSLLRGVSSTVSAYHLFPRKWTCAVFPWWMSFSGGSLLRGKPLCAYLSHSLISVSTFVPSETLTKFILLYPEWPPGSAHFPCVTSANQTHSFKTAFLALILFTFADPAADDPFRWRSVTVVRGKKGCFCLWQLHMQAE